jgi:8-oxo-dGTP pyrophosphatase MutT (NUDIX family)
MNPTKACAIVLRARAEGVEVLAFRHPTAGCQLVKGTIKANESPAAAAIRELFEEAGLSGARVVRDLGLWNSDYKSQVWSFHQLTVAKHLPDTWSHNAHDDGGHTFSFFWHPIVIAPSEEWHPVFVRALSFIKARSLSVQTI